MQGGAGRGAGGGAGDGRLDVREELQRRREQGPGGDWRPGARGLGEGGGGRGHAGLGPLQPRHRGHQAGPGRGLAGDDDDNDDDNDDDDYDDDYDDDDDDDLHVLAGRHPDQGHC